MDSSWLDGWMDGEVGEIGLDGLDGDQRGKNGLAGLDEWRIREREQYDMFKLTEPGFLMLRCIENYVYNQLNSNHFKNLQITSYISEDLFQAKSTFFLYYNL